MWRSAEKRSGEMRNAELRSAELRHAELNIAEMRSAEPIRANTRRTGSINKRDYSPCFNVRVKYKRECSPFFNC